MVEKDSRRGVSPVVAEMAEVINGLVELCAKNGLSREALSIVFGQEIPEPKKRGPGAPQMKNAKYRHQLASFLEIEAHGPGEKRGARTRVAEALARAEVGEQNRSAAWRSEVKKRTRSRQNDLSRLSPAETIRAAYFVRCIRASESFKTANARLDAAMAGNAEAQHKVFEIVRDLVGTHLTKIREL
jgi:hypothetical protein